MMKPFAFYLFLLIFVCFVGPINAQINFKVGLGAKYLFAPNHNALVAAFNDTRSDELFILEQPLEDLGMMTGVMLGIRNKMDQMSIELNWEYLSRKRESYGEVTSGGNLYAETLYYNSIDTYVGVNFHGQDRISYGIALGPRFMRIRRDIANSDFRVDMTKKSNPQWTSKIYFQWEFGGTGNTRFALRPSYDFAWNSIDLEQMKDDLDIVYNGDLTDRFNGIGLSLIFLNGPK